MTWPNGSSGSGANRDDSDHATDEDPGRDRSGGRQKGYRFAGTTVRREAPDGSVFWLSVCFPKPSRHVDPCPLLRRPGFLAGAKTFIEGTFYVVARRQASGACARGASGAAAIGCRESGNSGSTGLAASERDLALAFQNSMCHTPPCLWSGNTAAASLQLTTFDSSSS